MAAAAEPRSHETRHPVDTGLGHLAERVTGESAHRAGAAPLHLRVSRVVAVSSVVVGVRHDVSPKRGESGRWGPGPFRP